MNLLYVADNLIPAKATTEALRTERPYWEVSLVDQNSSALDALNEDDDYVAIVEVASENGKGFDLISALQAQHPTLPVIAISSSFSNGITDKISKYCDSSFLCDPSHIEDLVDTVERADAGI